jgi:TolA-binding protein
MYAIEKDWPKVIDVLTNALEVSPKHENIAECMFLIGYASFMEELYPDAIKWLSDLNTNYPGHDRVEEATYWLGMAYLFNTNYAEALRTFEGFIADFPNSPYREDATFRSAVCQYGLSEFRESERSLNAFVAAYPESALLGEAYMMQADVAGNFGELRAAVDRYAQALNHDLNIELYNYCNFRSAEMLQDLEDFSGIIAHFKRYIQDNRDGANIPLALYWIAKAMWQMGDQREAMDFLLKSVTTYGQDRTALGIDMLLEEWVSRSKNLPPAVAKEAWRDFGALLVKARKEDSRSLTLRLEHIFLFNPDLTDRARDVILDSIVAEDSISDASPSILEFILDEAPGRGKPQLARMAAETIVRDFPETDYVIAARMLLAEKAIEDEEYHVAEEHLNVIKDVFATSPEAAKALIMLGNMYLRQHKFAAADASFKRVLGVREWRGPLWPEAIYGRGECARLQRQYPKAAAFYERIYLLYSHYKTWAAKAYLQRANCLLRLQEDSKAREVLAEFLANEELADAPEADEARELMKRFERRNM